ncbi:uncharacterized protein [Procambarus clarkii]|uniref:uncharacterized protein n=1 Tax=Procambarus clarkii TaxID=6728 RepID=UPI001E676F9E|nr:C-type lectin mannose-binding isoform-like [Procambarus clarkii]
MKTDVVPLVAALVGALLPLATAQIAYCPAPYILIGGEACLYIPGGTYTWDGARDLCHTITVASPYSSHLAEIESCNVLSSLWNYIKYKLERPGNYWIGGSDSGSEGTWYWERTTQPDVPKGAPFWFTEEPDGDDLENHLVVATNGFFADGQGDQLYGVICQAII